mmetsp:Transcript_9056/g.26293  ORF Transcript_9056/g.26293 Transcript_9056/m.26293 type:complete len:273 (-) Transcript_9056:142-960(-)
MRPRPANNLWVAEHVDLAPAQGAESGDGDAIVLAEAEKLGLLVVGVHLKLVHHGLDAAVVQEVPEVVICEVAHANGPHQPLGVQGLQRAPHVQPLAARRLLAGHGETEVRLKAVREVEHAWPVQEDKVHVAHAEALEGLVEVREHSLVAAALGVVEVARACVGVILRRRVTNLSRDVNILTRDDALLEGLPEQRSNLVLTAILMCCVNVPVASLESNVHHLVCELRPPSAAARIRKEGCPEANHGDVHPFCQPPCRNLGRSIEQPLQVSFQL